MRLSSKINCCISTNQETPVKDQQVSLCSINFDGRYKNFKKFHSKFVHPILLNIIEIYI